MEEDKQTEKTEQVNSLSVNKGQEKPSGYLLWAILSTIFGCQPAGLVAIIYAAQIHRKWEQKDYIGAHEAARAAKIWTIVATGLGLLIFLSLFVTNLVIEAMNPTQAPAF